MLTWLSQNAAGLGILGAAIAFAWSVIQFILDRRKDLQTKEFEAYHRLVKELVSPDAGTQTIWIDRQAAVVFELRHFPRYYDFTERMLGNLKRKWEADPNFKWPHLINEIELTLSYIKK